MSAVYPQLLSKMCEGGRRRRFFTLQFFLKYPFFKTVASSWFLSLQQLNLNGINELVLENPKNTSGLSYGIMARSYSHFDVKFYIFILPYPSMGFRFQKKHGGLFGRFSWFTALRLHWKLKHIQVKLAWMMLFCSESFIHITGVFAASCLGAQCKDT